MSFPYVTNGTFQDVFGVLTGFCDKKILQGFHQMKPFMNTNQHMKSFSQKCFSFSN